MEDKINVSSGVPFLDGLLGGLLIGDNVIWYDDAGSLASVYCHHFLRISQEREKPVIYLTFDRSPRNLKTQLGALWNNPRMTVLDCFTFGKGAGSPIFLKFYEETGRENTCPLVRVEKPQHMEQVEQTLYDLLATMNGEVRLVFESLTGMAELWGGEEQVLQFYSRSCPRLYELNTVAYWIMEKKAHSPRLRAQINQIAQVVIELAIRRGTTSLTIVKAEKRETHHFHQPFPYWAKDQRIVFEGEKKGAGGVDLGRRIKDWRTRKGLSQTEMARLVGVTPSTISQVESNLIYPSLPALLKMAEVLSVNVGVFFQEEQPSQRLIFSSDEGEEIRLEGFPPEALSVRRLIPFNMNTRTVPYLIEIPPNQRLLSHFFTHKGEEVGFLLSGSVRIKTVQKSLILRAGELIYLISETPQEWENQGPALARLLWLLIK